MLGHSTQSGNGRQKADSGAVTIRIISTFVLSLFFLFFYDEAYIWYTEVDFLRLLTKAVSI